MARSIAFHRSLLGRSILFGVLPAAALVLLVVALNGYRAWNDVTETLESDLRNATELALREIDLRNQRNTELVKLMVIAQESGQFGRRAETREGRSLNNIGGGCGPRMPHNEFKPSELDTLYPSFEAAEDLRPDDVLRLGDESFYSAGTVVV